MMIIYHDIEEDKYYTYDAMKELFQETETETESFYQWLNEVSGKNGTVEKIYINERNGKPMTAESLFNAYIENHYQPKKGYKFFDMDIQNHPTEYFDDDYLIGFVIYQRIGGKDGYIEVWEANDSFGIVCNDDDELNVNNVEDIKLYYDSDICEFVTESRLIQSYCNQMLDGDIDTSESFDGWKNRLLNENLKKIL